ncbi:MAG TPA: hypothetical protein VFT05_07510 [Burkholderiaceae bacterium]|nr:hypothetical protein [Burkholderiaceae bacterium]
MSFSDETLMAYADGELSEPVRSEVERALGEDPALAARVARHQALRADVFAAFAPIAEEPVPPALLAAAMPGKVGDLQAARVARAARAARAAPVRRWSWPEWGAIAASLAVGVIAGSVVLGGRNTQLQLAAGSGADDVLVAHGRLDRALSRRLAGAGQDDEGVKIGVTFAARDGKLCRSFTADGAAGLACRSGDHWQLAVLAEAPKGAAGDYRQAGSAMPAAVLDAIDARIAGPAFDAGAERAAQQRGWVR